jgi:hypothetical protein
VFIPDATLVEQLLLMRISKMALNPASRPLPEAVLAEHPQSLTATNRGLRIKGHRLMLTVVLSGIGHRNHYSHNVLEVIGGRGMKLWTPSST